MSCSEARLNANRANALRSTGPRTEAGKATARRNALKHGLTGDGVVILDEDVAEIARRKPALVAELAGDGSSTSRLLAERVASLSVRLERSFRHDLAMTADRVRAAVADFDEARRAEAARLLAALDADPIANHRRLLDRPEGVDLLLDALEALRAVAAADAPGSWTEQHSTELDRLLGRRGNGGSPARCDAPTGTIDAEITRLTAHRATLDLDLIALERAEAADRALVDTGPEATNARKYEAATERSIFRALRELKDYQRHRDDRVTLPSALAAETARAIASAREQLATLPVSSPEPVPQPPLASFFPPPAPAFDPIDELLGSVGKPAFRPRSGHLDRKKRPRIRR